MSCHPVARCLRSAPATVRNRQSCRNQTTAFASPGPDQRMSTRRRSSRNKTSRQPPAFGPQPLPLRMLTSADSRLCATFRSMLWRWQIPCQGLHEPTCCLQSAQTYGDLHHCPC
uniref:(northern house mosquito) hypothetical protein n=1 Tax=Culex pipiens TaxID=7175 RepID=A0A8D8A541_CULPI